MAFEDDDIVAHEIMLVRRLVRLFRVEREGDMARRWGRHVERLIRRRGELIDALLRMDAARRSLLIPITPELRQVTEALWQESAQSIRTTDAKLHDLRDDLLMARGNGIPSGLRGLAEGRVIGKV